MQYSGDVWPKEGHRRRADFECNPMTSWEYFYSVLYICIYLGNCKGIHYAY
jgi:hypothetical protein